ncbi:PGN_0703 family putative restriction endonuclease [Planomicrobium okeanokoites]|uniref:PGN_0703 family putative restriction endonuclease n=1 Tax=Planomicrobium okeanokoites TaxID=244 RepID=UPI0030F6F8C3
MTYKEQVKSRLAHYKLTTLGVVENGKWKTNDKEYPHILPVKQMELNFLEPYRTGLTNFTKQQRVHLHRDFHHLNSSQAICLNFFYPLIEENQLSLLLDILKFSNEDIDFAQFEKILDRTEGTNFDFYIKLKSGKQIFFEIKYTESGFGKQNASEVYQEKYEGVYKERLTGKLRIGTDNYDSLMKNYQLLRNISYVDATDQSLLVIIYPEGNLKLKKEYEDLLNNVIDPDLHKNMQLITWENLWKDLMESLASSPTFPQRLRDQYILFGEKYL